MYTMHMIFFSHYEPIVLSRMLAHILKCLLRTISLKKMRFSQKFKNIREFVSKCCFPLKVCFYVCSSTDVFKE